MKVNDSPSAPALPVLESNFYIIELSKKILCIQIVKFPLKQKNEEEKNFSIFSFEVMSTYSVEILVFCMNHSQQGWKDSILKSLNFWVKFCNLRNKSITTVWGYPKYAA